MEEGWRRIVEGYGSAVAALLGIHLCHVADEFQDLVGIAPFVVVPADQLDKPTVEHDACLFIKDGGAGVSDKVTGYQRLITVTKDALHTALAGLLYGRTDFLIGGVGGQPDGQIYDRDIQGGYTEGWPTVSSFFYSILMVIFAIVIAPFRRKVHQLSGAKRCFCLFILSQHRLQFNAWLAAK